MAHEIKNLNARQFECLELEMANPSWTSTELSKAMNVSPKTIWKWKHSPIYIAELDKKIRERFKEQSKRAQKELENIAYDPDTGKRDRLTALMFLLKCANYEPQPTTEVNVQTNNILIKINPDDNT